MNLAIIREWYIIVPMIVVTIFTIGVGLWASKQKKKREELMSKKDEEKAMKEALELFEQELSRELEKIEMSDNPLEALMNLGKEPELDPIKDFNHPRMLKKPEGEYEQ